ncbi:uncharacterized protein [Coffea arabica]|uniref:Uncharacterized protein isoform X1 n=2 Tax=Coffea TaxID=13442 RepID=A0A6P6XAB5_COFAR|nr:uncharacterized protein LOC113741391 isoform X1 [Coffea arabica]
MNCHEINSMIVRSDSYHQTLRRHSFSLSSNPPKKPRIGTVCSASIFIKPLGLPLFSKTTQSPSKSFHLEPNKPYTIGRDYFCCDFLFIDRKISKSHCQILFNSSDKKVFLADGVFFGIDQIECSSRVRASLNGVFANGIRIRKGEVVELHGGDEILLSCGNGSDCNVVNRIGFFVERIVLSEEVVDRNVPNLMASGMSIDYGPVRLASNKLDVKAGFLLSMCRDILCSNDPISFMKKHANLDGKIRSSYSRRSGKKFISFLKSSGVKSSSEDRVHRLEVALSESPANCRDAVVNCYKGTIISSERNTGSQSFSFNENAEEKVDNYRLQQNNGVNVSGKPKALSLDCPRVADMALCDRSNVSQDKIEGGYVSPPGRKFYLNRLQFMGHCSSEAQDVVSLPELFYPVESLQRVFIATFTSDIPWFLSYCRIPAHLPITIACHNAERCWSSNPERRTSYPFTDFPRLVVVYPPFPEVIAFGKDRRKSGIACHHPKLFVLQREDTLRVVVTSANLVARQWNNVTNTVWWQDFPRSCTPDYGSLFNQSSLGGNNQDSKSDFGAQLAGFMASLVADVPSQAHWILELAKYSFKGALVHLVASVPGIHTPKSPYMLHSRHFLSGNKNMQKSSGRNLLGSVETSVVGMSHLFCTSVDSNGVKLKKLAAFLRKCSENAYGMSEIILRRETNILADVNAVSVLIPNPEEFSLGDCVQIGFLPRDVAQWVAPLSDDGFFAFSAYIYPKEVLRAALEGSYIKVQLILYVSQGPCFSGISNSLRCQQVSAICSLVSSIHRCVGLWRLQEVLAPYKWPEHLETDFLFGSSSIGSVNAQFVAAFSAASGKRAAQLSESEESDPHWGCWSASQELRNPSIKVIFPTIERVKTASCGILASKYILCFSQKTWQRLKNVGILHDAIPYPNERSGFPMHVKVARRRFQSKTDASSFGWVYCGSHNFSAAAWGRPLPNTVDRKVNVNERNSSVLGSRIHICNYELGIIFTVPPSDKKDNGDEKHGNLDDIVLPFATPAPKYKPRDEPATAQAMREVLTEMEREMDAAIAISGECPDEEDEVLEAADFVTVEKEDEKAYAERLWSQVDSSESC